MRFSERAAYCGIKFAAAIGVMICCVPLVAILGGDKFAASRPPMGWNSWDSYGTAVREEQVKANADAMVRELQQFGWQYIVVDIQWYEPNAGGHDYRAGAPLAMDDYGRMLPAASRFPSAGGGAGFKDLAAYVRGKGLKFGIHIMRGIPRQAVEQTLPIQVTGYRAADIADRVNLCDWNQDMYGVDMSTPGAEADYDSIVVLYVS
jgi:alpha-galactosidase